MSRSIYAVGKRKAAIRQPKAAESFGAAKFIISNFGSLLVVTGGVAKITSDYFRDRRNYLLLKEESKTAKTKFHSEIRLTLDNIPKENVDNVIKRYQSETKDEPKIETEIRLFSILSLLKSSEKSNQAPTAIVIELLKLPSGLSEVMNFVYLTFWEHHHKSHEIKQKEQEKVTILEGNDVAFPAKSFVEQYRDLKDMLYADPEDKLVSRILISNKELIRSYLMGYLAHYSVGLWIRAYFKFANFSLSSSD